MNLSVNYLPTEHVSTKPFTTPNTANHSYNTPTQLTPINYYTLLVALHCVHGFNPIHHQLIYNYDRLARLLLLTNNSLQCRPAKQVSRRTHTVCLISLSLLYTYHTSLMLQTQLRSTTYRCTQHNTFRYHHAYYAPTAYTPLARIHNEFASYLFKGTAMIS